MTARRIVVAILALASLTIGIYAQGGGGAQGAGAQGAGGRPRGRPWRRAPGGPPQPGHLMPARGARRHSLPIRAAGAGW